MYPPKPSQTKIFPVPYKGVVEQTIAPNQPGRVKAIGSCWPAELYNSECQADLLPDRPVLVVGINNITLLVVPL